MSLTVTATEARNDLFKLLNRVIYKGETVYITKAGTESMIKVTSVPASSVTLSKLAGSISNKDASVMKTAIAAAKNYPSRKVATI